MNHRIELHGEKGSILVDGESIVKWETTEDKQEEKEGDEDKIGSSASDPKAIGKEGHQAQIYDLIQAIREDREPMVTGREARKAVEIILAIYESSRTGRPVNLPLSS